jgi:hypothetical protein
MPLGFLPKSVSLGQAGIFPPIHHHLGLDNGDQPLLLISIGSQPKAVEKIALSSSSMRVHSTVKTTLSDKLMRCLMFLATTSWRSECFPNAPDLLVLRKETSLQGTPAVIQNKESGCSATTLFNQKESSDRISPIGIASGQWAEVTSTGSLAISLKKVLEDRPLFLRAKVAGSIPLQSSMATTCGEELFFAGGAVPSNVLLTGPGGRSSVTVRRYSPHFLTLPLPAPLPLPLPGEEPEDPLDAPCLPSSWVLAVWFLLPQMSPVTSLALQAWGYSQFGWWQPAAL